MKEPSLRHALIDVEVSVDDLHDQAAIRRAAARVLKRSVDDVPPFSIARRAIDARRGRVSFVLTLNTGAPDTTQTFAPPRQVKGEKPVVIVGMGPTGLFCAHQLARAGIPSVVLERGLPVQPRRKDLKLVNQRGTVDPESNYCFGEGGAGTFSDGKLYTRSTKRGDVRDVLQTFVTHGAPSDILVDARPHIGSNKLPVVIDGMRRSLEQVGVVFRFSSRVDGLVVDGARVTGVRLAHGEKLEARGVVVATGHSARDVYHWLRAHDVDMEAKSFALGVRIEHPQALIDEIQYGRYAGHSSLRAAPYRLTTNIENRGVFSFCMCPGGFVVPATTAADEVVLNGMSLSRRDSPFANSGIVVSVEPEDYFDSCGTDVLSGLAFQSALERRAFTAGGGGFRAPAVRMTDFFEQRESTTLPPTSYQPGVASADLAHVLDAAGTPIAHRLREGLKTFARQMNGFLTEEAILLGVESRTSSPVRVKRNSSTLMSTSHQNLYPGGEGAGFAGGIISAALDGIRIAEQISRG